MTPAQRIAKFKRKYAKLTPAQRTYFVLNILQHFTTYARSRRGVTL